MTFNFIDEAIKTKSNKFYGDRISHAEFVTKLARAIDALNDLDAIKKTLFYGKEYTGKQGIDPVLWNSTIWYTNRLEAKSLPTGIEKQDAIDLIHGLLGKATEAGEGLEALSRCIVGNESFDLINIKEEVFDSQWYDAIICKALGITFEEGQRSIIDKLRERFSDKFTEHDANNRNLDAERKVLES